MKPLTKAEIDELKGEYVTLGYRTRWTEDDRTLMKQLLDNGINSASFVQKKFFTTRTVSSVNKMLSDIRLERK